MPEDKPKTETSGRVSEVLCEYSLGLKGRDIPRQVIVRTKEFFLDFLAVAFGGRQVADSSAILIRGVKSLMRGARGTCSVIGERDLYPPHYAAVLNGAFAHSMDFDDTHREAVMHTGTTVFPTLLAVAEDSGASGSAFLEAAVVGYDVANKIGKAHGTSVNEKGFHSTATTGIFACTCAGARLMGLSLAETRNALGLNISQAAGSFQFAINGSWEKRLHTGLAAHNAILSLFFAREGYLGGIEPIEGKYGYFALYTNASCDPAAVLNGLGVEFEVMNTAMKPYPCCRCSHTAIEAISSLVRENDLSPEDIAAIDIKISEYSHNLVGIPTRPKKAPSNIVDAQFSLYFAAAVAAQGDYTWQCYERFPLDARMRDLMARVTIGFADGLGRFESDVRIDTRNGQHLNRRIVLPPGEPEVPMSPEQCAKKFRDCALPALGPRKTDEVLSLVMDDLEGMADMTELTRLLRVRL